jgi:tetratricopeptide (TPR) repeat protein
MSYRGNPDLAPDVQERIVSTFRQTLDLAAGGSVQEATLGCDFILRMDPDFEPARTLLGRLEQAGGPVGVDDLRGAADGTGGADEPSAEELFDELDDLDLGTSPPARAARPADLTVQIDQRIAARDFAGALEAARGFEDDPEVARRVAAARERQEAAPYVQRFLDGARTAASAGDAAAARGHLDKAASLDPGHPGVVDLQRRLGPAAAAAPAGGEPPAAPAPPPPAAPVPGDRIGELLAEGQTAFERGAYQDAIDAWSRIFLIDVDHEEASRRIEEARQLKAEQERKVEEVFHEALTHLEAGEHESARRGFERVLEMHPGHMAARERLDELSAGTAGTAPAPAPAPASAAAPPPRRSGDTTGWDLKEEILIPPEPGEARPAAADAGAPAVAGRTRAGRGRKFGLIGAAVLVLAAAALAFLYLNRERLFPNAQEPAAVATAPDPIARAAALHEEGKTQLALDMLRRIPAGAPQYGEAQALISQWEASGEPAGEAEAEPEGPSAEDLALREELLAAGRQAYADREYLRAQELFDGAAEIAPLGEPEATLRADTEGLLAPLASQIAMFRDGQYEFALPALWRMREESPDDPVVRRLIVDSYYNLAVRDLQRGNVDEAADKLREVLTLTPDDRVAARHLRFAETYLQREKDLLYRIYVKYLPGR